MSDEQPLKVDDSDDDPLAPGERTSILEQPGAIPVSPSFERRVSMDNLAVSERGSRGSPSRSSSVREIGLVDIHPPILLSPQELTLEQPTEVKPLNG